MSMEGGLASPVVHSSYGTLEMVSEPNLACLPRWKVYRTTCMQQCLGYWASRTCNIYGQLCMCCQVACVQPIKWGVNLWMKSCLALVRQITHRLVELGCFNTWVMKVVCSLLSDTREVEPLLLSDLSCLSPTAGPGKKDPLFLSCYLIPLALDQCEALAFF